MKFIEYARRRRMGYSIQKSVQFANSSDSGDLLIAGMALAVLVWLLVDSVAGIA